MHVALGAMGFLLFAWSMWVVLERQYRVPDVRHGFGGWICNRLNPVRVFHDSEYSPDDMRDACIVLFKDGVYRDPGWHTKKAVIDGLPAALADGERAWVVGILQGQRDFGVWAGTRRRMSAYLNDFEAVGPYDKDWDYAPPETREESDGLRTAAMDALRGSALESVWRGRTELIADGDWSGTHAVWSGYAINTATVVGFVMWVWFTPVVVMDVVRWRRGRRVACTRCGYDVRGLGEGARVCPECGNPLIHDAGEPPHVSPAPPQK